MARERVYIPKRYILVVMAHFAFFVIYALRVNFSVAIVAMINSTYAHVDSSHDSECGGVGINATATHKEKDGEFNWDQHTQGLVLSSFFYGYLLTQIPGGWLAVRYGGKWVLAIGVLLTSLFSMLSPLAARTNFTFFIVTRIVQGFGEGVTYPAMHALISKWAPLNEQSRIAMFSYSGATTGTVLTLPICSMLAGTDFLGGWPSNFYVFGALGVVWFLLWITIASNSPDHHPSISYDEKMYITDSLKNSVPHTSNITVPWSHIFTSIRAWAIIVAHFSHNWVFYLVLTGLPLYFKQVLDFDLKENGFLSALPFLTGFISIVGSGVLADFLIKNFLTVTQTRRLIGILAFYPTAACLIIASFAKCGDNVLPVTCFVLGTGFLHLNNSSYNLNHLDIAPRFASVLFGITNTAGTICGCITPLVTGYITDNEPTRANYRKVFLIAAGVAVVGGTFFNIFVSGEQQPWNNLDTTCSKTIHGFSNTVAEMNMKEVAEGTANGTACSTNETKSTNE